MIGLSLFHFALAGDCQTAHGILPSLYDGLCNSGSSDIKINSVSDALVVVANVVRILIALAGGIAVIMILVAAVYYITATGNPSQIKQAKDIIVSTVSGLVVIILAYAVVTFIAGQF